MCCVASVASAGYKLKQKKNKYLKITIIVSILVLCSLPVNAKIKTKSNRIERQFKHWNKPKKKNNAKEREKKKHVFSIQLKTQSIVTVSVLDEMNDRFFFNSTLTGNVFLFLVDIIDFDYQIEI